MQKNIQLVTKYRKVLVELDEIIKRFNPITGNKIPQGFIKYLYKNKDPYYIFHYDENKKLTEQNVMQETKILFAIIYRRYFCDENTLERLKRKDMKLEK